MNSPRAVLHPLWRCVLLILAVLLLVGVIILLPGAIALAQVKPGEPKPGEPVPGQPVPGQPNEPGEPKRGQPEPGQPKKEAKAEEAKAESLPLILLVGMAAAAGALWLVLRRFRVRASVGVTPTQGQQTEGEQPEEKRDVEFELDVEPELGFEEAQATATVRVSGTEGVQYLGSYGNRREQRQFVEVRTLGAEPVDYLVEFQPGFDEVSATFQKRSPETGMLRVEILTDSRVQEAQATTAAFGGVTVSWKA